MVTYYHQQNLKKRAIILEQIEITSLCLGDLEFFEVKSAVNSYRNDVKRFLNRFQNRLVQGLRVREGETVMIGGIFYIIE